MAHATDAMVDGIMAAATLHSKGATTDDEFRFTIAQVIDLHLEAQA